MKIRKGNIVKQSIVILTLATFALGLGILWGAQAWAAALDPGTVRAAALAAGVDSLANVPVPEVVNLNEFLKPGPEAQKAAIRLGKALFWDMQVGSDGQACGTCHFHAGADNRARNQLSPGLKAGDGLFGNNTIGAPGFPQFTPDYTLVDTDFPFHILADPEENNFLNRVVLADTNDVVSSMGVFAATFLDINPGVSEDIGSPFTDPVFNILNPDAFSIDDNVRRVEPRNTPTMINAVFNHSNFWDGRAHNVFNGVSVIGPLDEGAMIWVNEAGQLVQKQVRFPNSSLASQAVGPVLSNLEMSFFDRSFPLVGRKLFNLRPLGMQMVDPKDSVLGEISGARHGLNGIDLSYKRMIRQAFQSQYWSSDQLTPDGYKLMEANFSLFFGLAVQMYETTLVSDKTPFDRFMQGRNRALEEEQLIGLLVFLNRGKRVDGTSRNVAEMDAVIAETEAALGITIGAGNCVSCHGGPELTDASVANVSAEPIEVENTTILVDGFLQASDETSFIDNGFANIGVRQIEDDLGRGEGEAQGFPFPLSLARQALLGLEFAPELPDDECGVDPVCPVDNRVSVDGAFKIPGLRNVGLTGPYFHNGGQATLDQVVEFYDRQGDFSDHNVDNLERNMSFINLHDADEEPLVEFLLALTDDRVRNEKAPFDHPQIFVPDGGTFAFEDVRIEIPAVGADGRPGAGLPPLVNFLEPEATFAISGTITSRGNPLAGVTVNLAGDAEGSVTTDAAGVYSFTELAVGKYAVTPVKEGFTFTPPSRNVTISGKDVTGQNFTGNVAGFSISGKVTDRAGAPLAGAIIRLFGPVNKTTATNASGNYSLAGLRSGRYEVMPSLAGFRFTPLNRDVKIKGSSASNQNFRGLNRVR